jgi:hypothetical protein
VLPFHGQHAFALGILVRPDRGQRWPSRLVATAAENRCGVEFANVKSLGLGFAIWLFGYLSEGHAPLFDWNAITPWWISSFLPNLQAELGMVLMFASTIPIYWGAVRKRAFAYTAFLIFVAVTLAWWRSLLSSMRGIISSLASWPNRPSY